MTISTTVRKFTYTGNGATTVFAFPAYFILPGHLIVTLITVANGTRTPLVLGTDYSITGAGNLAGGAVTTQVAYSSAFQVEIARTVPITQQTDYLPNDTLPAEIVELDFDYLTMICQQLDDRVTTLETIGPGSSLVTLANVGTGTGTIFRDKVGNTYNLKTIKAGTGVTITNNADDVTIATAAGGIALPGTTNQFYRGDGNFSNTFLDGPFILNFAASNDTLQWLARAAAVDFKYWSWRLSYPDTLALWAQKDDFTYVGKALEFVRDTGATIKTSSIGGRVLMGGAVDDLASALQVQGAARLTTPLAIAYGGSGQSTQQAAINALSNASAATAGQVLTRDNLGNAVFGTGATLFINVKSQFGAKGDNATDDTAAIQAAINSVPTNTSAVVYFPHGTYKLTAQLTITNSSTMLLGEGQYNSILNQYTTNAKIINNSGTTNLLEKLGFTYNGTPIAGATALYSTGANFVCRDFIITKAYDAIAITGGTGQRFHNFQAQSYVNSGIRIIGPVSDGSFSGFIANAGAPPNGANGGIYMTDQCEAIWIGDADVLGGVIGIQTDAPTFGYVIGGRPAANRITNVFFDSGSQSCILDKTVETEFVGCWFSNGRTLGGFAGVSLLQTDGMRFTNCIAFNCGAHGFDIQQNSLRTVFVNCKAESNGVNSGPGGANGFNFHAGVTDFALIGCAAHNGLYTPGTQGYGIAIAAGASDRYIIDNCLLYGNATGNFQDLGTGVVKYINELSDNRFRGDFTNASDSARKLFQTTLPNANSFVGVIPSGTALNGIFQAYNAADPNNAAWIRIQAGNGACDVQSNKNGTGVVQPLRFLVNGVVGAQLDTSANFQLAKGESCAVGAVDTANRTLLTTDRYLRGSVTGGSFAYTLPAANALGAGISQIIDIKRTDSSANVLTVQRAGADTVDGLLSVTINALGALQFRSNGVSNWDVL